MCQAVILVSQIADCRISKCRSLGLVDEADLTPRLGVCIRMA